MRLLFLIVLIFCTMQIHAQVGNFLTYQYIDCLESNYQMDTGISWSQIKEGSYQKAQEHIASEYFQQHQKEAFFLQILLDYNTKGKQFVDQKISEKKLGKEDEDFLRLWLSYYSQNVVDYDVLKKKFKKNYPQNLNFLKLELKKSLNERKLSSDDIGFTQKIDSVLQLQNISKEVRLFFKLTKIDVSKYHKDYDQNKQVKYHELAKIWKGAPEQMNDLYIAKHSKVECSTEECVQMKQWIAQQAEKTKPLQTSEKIYKLLLHQSKSEFKLPIPDLEKKITELISLEKNALEIQQSKALVGVYSMTKEPDLGFFFKGMFKFIPFSEAFKNKNALNMTKPQVLNEINLLVKNTAKTNSNIFDVNGFQKFRDEIIKYSLDDIKIMYGLMVFMKYYTPELEKAFASDLGMYKEFPPDQVYYNSKLMLDYLKKNPLYYSDNVYTATEFTFKDIVTKNDLDVWKKEMKSLIDQYPNAYGIRLNYLTTISQFISLIPAAERADFYVNYFENVIDLLVVNQSIDFSSIESVLFYNFRKDQSTVSFYQNFKDFYQLLNPEQKKKMLNYISKKMEENPNSKQLNLVVNKIFEIEGGLAYLQHFFDQLDQGIKVGHTLDMDLFDEVKTSDIIALLVPKIDQYIK